MLWYSAKGWWSFPLRILQKWWWWFERFQMFRFNFGRFFIIVLFVVDFLFTSFPSNTIVVYFCIPKATKTHKHMISCNWQCGGPRTRTYFKLIYILKTNFTVKHLCVYTLMKTYVNRNILRCESLHIIDSCPTFEFPVLAYVALRKLFTLRLLFAPLLASKLH